MLPLVGFSSNVRSRIRVLFPKIKELRRRQLTRTVVSNYTHHLTWFDCEIDILEDGGRFSEIPKREVFDLDLHSIGVRFVRCWILGYRNLTHSVHTFKQISDFEHVVDDILRDGSLEVTDPHEYIVD